MNRTFGFEKTIQSKQFEPIKISTYISDVPMEVWSEDGFVDKINDLMMIQIRKALVNDLILDRKMREADSNKYSELLSEIEHKILEDINLQGIVLNININIEEKK